MDSARAEVVEGLNVFRALEAWGAALYAAWAATEPNARLRAGHLIIAEREANHARLLAERIRALGGEPGPACVDGILLEQMAELRDLKGFLAQLDGLKRVTARDASRMVDCRRALDRGLEVAATTDPATHAFLMQIYSEEKVSGAWYRSTYSELSGRRPQTESLPILAPGQVERRASSARGTSGESVACTL